jgi:hypothetical protein
LRVYQKQSMHHFLVITDKLEIESFLYIAPEIISLRYLMNRPNRLNTLCVFQIHLMHSEYTLCIPNTLSVLPIHKLYCPIHFILALKIQNQNNLYPSSIYIVVSLHSIKAVFAGKHFFVPHTPDFGLSSPLCILPRPQASFLASGWLVRWLNRG